MSTTSCTPRPSRAGDRDDGFALIAVIGGMTTLLVIVTVMLTYSTKSLGDVRQTEKWNQAFVAAESGVSDYLARLNKDDGYWRTLDCSNVALRGPRTDSACSYTSATAVGWVGVPGSQRAQFHYDVSTATTYNTGMVLLTSTGRVGDVTRTVQVRLRRSGFGEFLYYTMYETIDPANEAIYGYNNTTADDRCSHYYWEPYVAGASRPRDTSYCSDINFVTGDVIDGPVHTNDAMLISGRPIFNGTTTTSYPTCKTVNDVKPPAYKCYRGASSGATPSFNKGIAYRPEVKLPESAADLRRYVDKTQTPVPGCLYTGPTRIKLLSSTAATSTMQVWSNWSKTTLNPGCGNASSSWPQTVTIPNNNIVVVQDVPATQSTPSSGSCATGAIGDSLPQSGDFSQTLRESDCRYGTVYLEGSLKGRLTIAADNNIVVTGPLTYGGGTQGTDALGLVANNSVKIYHPTRCTQTNYYGQCTSWQNMQLPNGSYNYNISVQAAILTLQHSFTVQQYQSGDALGKINLFGTIAQKFRGPVGTSGGSGYLKNYVYDTRLRFAPPPYFLDPVQSAWDVKTFGELTARY
jgi:hypothetical protein